MSHVEMNFDGIKLHHYDADAVFHFSTHEKNRT